MKLRNKLFVGLLVVQTFTMLMFLILAFNKVYSKHLKSNFEYSGKVYNYVQEDLTKWSMFSDTESIEIYLEGMKKDLEVAHSSILQKVEVKDQFDQVLVSKDFKYYNQLRKGVIPLLVKSVLGDYYRTKSYNLEVDGQITGSVDITISNRGLINSTINLVRMIVFIWFVLLMFMSVIYYIVINYLTKNITALNKIIDNLEHENYDMKEIELTYKSDEISQLVNSIRHISSNIVKQTKINKKLSLQKSILLANISNNMLTPLNGISGAVDLLKINHNSEEDKRTIKFIESSATLLLNQITNILTYMELKESNSKLSFSACMMSDLVYSAFKTSKNSLSTDKNIKLKFSDSDDATKVFVKADIAKLQTVFNNVIENAIDFTNSGYVNVEVSSVAIDNKYVRYQVCVEDTGSGISEDRLEKIQESLSKQNEVDIQTKVTGLGLTISSLILQKMRGGITLHSVEGHGTTAVIEIIAEKSSISRVL